MKIYALILALITCSNLNARKGKLFISSWHEGGVTELTIPSDKYFYYGKGKLYYFLSNDYNNIYVDLKIEDEGAKSRILKQGLTVWINMDSKLTKKMGIRFPVGSQNSGGQNKLNLPYYNLNTDESIVTLLSLANTIELIGFPNEDARPFSADNADSFRGSLQCDNEKTLHYKMLLPISKLPIRNSKDGKGAMPFTFGIEYGPAKAQTGFPPVLLWIKNIKFATDK